MSEQPNDGGSDVIRDLMQIALEVSLMNEIFPAGYRLSDAFTERAKSVYQKANNMFPSLIAALNERPQP